MVNVQRLTAAVSMAVATFAQANDANFKCTGINFGIRAGPDWAPAEEKCKPASQIATELAVLKGVTDVIRLYSLMDCNQATAVVPAAIEAGLKIELGIWVDASTSSFEAEKAVFKTLLETGLVTADNIVGIHVGSEAVYRGDVTVSVAIANLEEIRALCHANPAAASIPLTIADIGDTYTAHPELIEVVDYVSANYFPFWELAAIDGAADHFYERFSALVKIVSTYNKEVIVGETGWASQGTSANGSIATEANAAKFFYDFYTLATEKNLTYYYFSAFDEPWKLATLEAGETVEAYFGLFTEEGVLKDAIASQFGDSTKSVDSSGLPPTVPSSDATAVQEVAGADELSANEVNSGKTGAEVPEDPTKAAETTSAEVPEDLTKTAETTESHEDCAM
uniref:glucan endo-1,3-beta-D-glucosidase n=1 Tax=Peronospora matthiolae TaxID=2874970 RepID=A0AAV1TCI8_9STRA